MNRLLRDRDGSSMLEATLVLPVVLLVALGTIDFTYMLYEWALASKAAEVGARIAVVTDPVAVGITNLTYDPTLISEPCFDATGAANGNCPTVDTVCTPTAAGGACTNGYAFDNTAFISDGGVLAGMKTIFPRLGRTNVQIAYHTTGLGFVGRPSGLPMSVTVSIRCMAHNFYFIGGLMAFFTGSAWTYTAPDGCPAAPTGPQIPAFATTLTSEDMTTN